MATREEVIRMASDKVNRALGVLGVWRHGPRSGEKAESTEVREAVADLCHMMEMWTRDLHRGLELHRARSVSQAFIQ